MPLIDMPLEELRSYAGRNPKPADFDRYWDESLAEMRAIDPKIELIPYDIGSNSADLFHLYFTGVGGARVHAQYLRPKHATGKHPAVVRFHGYNWFSGDWQEKLMWTSQGYSVAALDVRGQCGLSQDVGGTRGRTSGGHFIHGMDDDDPKKMLFRSVFLDTAQLANIVMQMPEVDPDRVGVHGGSQGGALTLACAALEPRVKKAAAHHPFLSDYQRVWEMDLAVAAYQELKDYFRWFDPAHEREAAIFERLGYIDIQHLAPRIRGEVWMGCGLMDTICPPSSQFAAFNKIAAPKQVVIWPDYGHEVPPGGHDAVFRFLSDL
jgi:cephalosporin-C deacetylase